MSDITYCPLTIHLVPCGHDCPGCDAIKTPARCTEHCGGVWYPEECGKAGAPAPLDAGASSRPAARTPRIDPLHCYCTRERMSV